MQDPVREKRKVTFPSTNNLYYMEDIRFKKKEKKKYNLKSV